jgi:hypothetical protein
MTGRATADERSALPCTWVRAVRRIWEHMERAIECVVEVEVADGV